MHSPRTKVRCGIVTRRAGSVSLQELKWPTAVWVRHALLHVVKAQAADGAVHFKYGEGNVFDVLDVVFAKSALELVERDTLAPHVLFDDLAVVDQQRWLALDKFSKGAIGAGELANPEVQDEQCGGGDDAAGQRCVGASHRVLYGVAQEEKQGEIEGCHLSDLALAAEPDA